MTKHYDILIATPGSSLEHAYVRSLTDTLEACQERGLTVKWLNAQSSLVHHARELTASGTSGKSLDPHQRSPGGDLTYGVIVWIDSDISWKVSDFFKLVEAPWPVTTGVYLLADGTTTVHAIGGPGGIPQEDIKGMSGPIQIQSCGFGFVAVKRGVFEALPRPWFNHEYAKVGTASDGSPVIDCLGEDISWCVKAHRAGIPIWFDPSVRVSHHKTLPLSF